MVAWHPKLSALAQWHVQRFHDEGHHSKVLAENMGSKNIDQALLDYDYKTAHQTGAEFAPYFFISGYLFSSDILRLYQALRHPVWMVRGTRGDFVDYHHVSRVKNRPNGTFDVLQTGAFPQFEALGQVTASYEAFLKATRLSA